MLATGDPSATLLDTLRGRERERAALQPEVAGLQRLQRTAERLDRPGLQATLRRAVQDWQALLEASSSGRASTPPVPKVSATPQIRARRDYALERLRGLVRYTSR